MLEKTDFEKMLEENKVLVSIETVKIKDFIFNTDKLKTIRGASYLLDYLNQVEVPRVLEKYGIKFDHIKLGKKIYNLKDDEFLDEITKKIDKYVDKRIIYIGAGNAKFFVKDEKEAKDICNEIRKIYEKLAPGVKIVTEFKEIEEGQKVWDVIDDLAQKTAEKKSEGFPLINIDLPFMEKCSLSGNEPAMISFEDVVKAEGENEDINNIIKKLNVEIEEVYSNFKIEGNIPLYDKIAVEELKKVLENKGSGIKISEATASKIKFSNYMIKKDEQKIGFYSIIKSALRKEDKYLELATSISDYAVKDNFIGLVYSDGDGLGDFLKGCKDRYKIESEYLNFLRRFSIVLDRNTKVALKEVLMELEPEFETVYKKDKEEYKIMGEFLIVGGDDVCAVFPADLAFEISEKFQKNFEEKMKKFAKSENDEFNNITSSGGVIIAKDKTPMYQLFEQGIKLQKSAKEKRHQVNKNIEKEKGNDFIKTGYTDFQNIGGEGLTNIKEYRKNGIDNWKVIQRPYSVNKVEIENKDGQKEIVKTLESLMEKVKKLKKSGFPNTKIRYIYDLKKNSNLTSNEKIMEAINILSKMNESEIKVLDEVWEISEKLKISMDNNKKIDELFDDIFDVLEIYDFIRDTKTKEEGGLK